MEQSWKKSPKVFREALSVIGESWKPVFWLIVGQILIAVLIYYYTMSFIDQAAPLSDISNSLYRLLGFVIVLLYQVLWTVALIRLLAKSGKKTMGFIFGKKLWNKYPQALLLTLIVGIALLIASFLLVIPGVILGVYWAFAIYIFILGDASIIDSLKKSNALVKGWWWMVFYRMIFLFGITLVVSLFAVVPGYGAFISYVLSLLLAPAIIVYMGLTYQELVKIKSNNPKAVYILSFAKKTLFVLLAVLALTLLAIVTAIGDFVISISANAA